MGERMFRVIGKRVSPITVVRRTDKAMWFVDHKGRRAMVWPEQFEQFFESQSDANLYLINGNIEKIKKLRLRIAKMQSQNKELKKVEKKVSEATMRVRARSREEARATNEIKGNFRVKCTLCGEYWDYPFDVKYKYHQSCIGQADGKTTNVVY